MILCCGEALVDMIPERQPDGRLAYMPHAGGAVYNTAVALGRLGVTTGLLSGVSTDPFGALLERGLDEAGVDTSALIRSARLTTLAMVHLEDGSASYSFYDENSAGRAITAAQLPELSQDVTALYFGGISLVAEPAADTYATLLSRAAPDHLVMLDPNIRPDFITDEVAYRNRLGRMIAQSDIVKVSDEDLDWLLPGEDPLPVKAAALRVQGPQIVIVTEGEDGATAFAAAWQVHVPAPAARVVDTVGAGDTFNAGVLAGLDAEGCLSKLAIAGIGRNSMRRALALGAEVAAITVSRAGADAPWRHELAGAPDA